MCVIDYEILSTHAFFYTINIFECIITPFLFVFMVLCTLLYRYSGGVSDVVSWKMALEIFLVLFIIYHSLVGLVLWSVTLENETFIYFQVNHSIMLILLSLSVDEIMEVYVIYFGYAANFKLMGKYACFVWVAS